MPKYKQVRQAVQLVAVLYAPGVAGPSNRPKYASYGAGVDVPNARPVGVEVLTEAQAATRGGRAVVNLARFAPGTAIPAYYRVITEKAVAD